MNKFFLKYARLTKLTSFFC